jgi:hypothetical protein
MPDRMQMGRKRSGSLHKLAVQFHVGWGYVKKIRAQQLCTGEKKRPMQLRHGPVSRMNADVQAKLCGWLRVQPNLTEAELCDRRTGTGVQASKNRVGQVLRQMGERRKKLCTPPSATWRPTSSGAKNSSPPSSRSSRRD